MARKDTNIRYCIYYVSKHSGKFISNFTNDTSTPLLVMLSTVLQSTSVKEFFTINSSHGVDVLPKLET